MSLVFKEVVVVSASQNMGLQALVWECPVLHLSTISAEVAGSATVWCCERDGRVPDLQMTEISGGGTDWLQHLTALLGGNLLWSCLLCLQRIAIVFSSLLQQLLGAAGSAAAVGQVLEQTRNDNGCGRCEAEGENKDHWGLVADGLGDVLLKEELGKVNFRSGFGDLGYRQSKGRGWR